METCPYSVIANVVLQSIYIVVGNDALVVPLASEQSPHIKRKWLSPLSQVLTIIL